MGAPVRKPAISAIIFINLGLVLCIILTFYMYSNSYSDTLQSQNITEITNINQSVAKISYSFYNNQKTKMGDITQYINNHETTVDEALMFIAEANSDVNADYEIIGTDYNGFVSVMKDGKFQPVSYVSGDYSNLKTIFESKDITNTEVLCTPEFTDQYTATKCFGLYRHIVLQGKNYTLMGVYKISNFAGLIDLDGGYKDCSTILMSISGDYVFGSSRFKSSNLFRYFYVYNGLSLDQMNEDAAAFAQGNKNIFYYKNSENKDCVYVISPVQSSEWYAVTCVTLDSFHRKNTDLTFNISIAVLMLAMLAFNVLWMRHSNSELKKSMAREIEASNAKTDFLSRMSHDIRTPLNVIIGSAFLAQKEKNPEPTVKYLHNIEESCQFLSSLVNDILDLNKVEVGKMELHPEPYSLPQLENSLEAIIAPLCKEKQLTLTMSGLDGNETYLLDRVRTNQIFFNLLSNSVKYTPAGGHIGFDCTVIQKEPQKELVFRIYDDGEGMSEEFQEHMFEAFTQETRKENTKIHGTGLGLAIVNNLVKLMHGTIQVKSALNQGTVFTITLPVEQVNATAMVNETISLDVLKQKKVLLCEDNKINAEIAVAMLQEKGMIVTIAENGQQAVDVFAQSTLHQYDVILMDMQMPIKTGIEAAKEIRSMSREDAATTPILAMTANAYDADVKNCINAGMNGHISKPISPEIMYQTIAKVL